MSCSSAYMTYKLLYSSLFSVSPVGSGSGGHSRTVLDSPSSVRSEGNRCKFCQKYYSSSWHRKRHELIHTGQNRLSANFATVPSIRETIWAFTRGNTPVTNPTRVNFVTSISRDNRREKHTKINALFEIRFQKTSPLKKKKVLTVSELDFNS